MSWSHYRTLLKIDNPKERNFYISQVAENAWSVRFLQKMIDSDFYYAQTEGYSLPKQHKTQSNKSRHLKSIIKNRGIAISGWAFIHPKSFQLPKNQLLFFHVIEQVFILICISSISEIDVKEVKKRLPIAFGVGKKALTFDVTPECQLVEYEQPSNSLHKKIKNEFNSSN